MTLNDEQVIGDDLRDVVRAALNYRAGRTLDESGYRNVFRQHFEYGCQAPQTSVAGQIWQRPSQIYFRLY